MIGFFDMHCHTLPGVDDGSKSVSMTKRMLVQAYNEGIRALIFTPHYHAGRMTHDKADTERRFIRIRDIISQWRSDFRVYLGCEIFYNHDLQELLDTGQVNTLADSSYVLIEFYPSDTFSHIKNGLAGLQLAGYYPILAHVERYKEIYEDITKAQELHKMGVYLQANSKSVIGDIGSTAKKFLKEAMDGGIIDFVATDAHDSIRRTPSMRKCADYIEKNYGKDYALKVLRGNQISILKNEIV